jgi:hypothetical protein
VGSRLALSATVAVGLQRREPCRKSILVGRRWPTTAEQEVPLRGPSMATSSAVQKETVFGSETGDEPLFNLWGCRRLSTTTQPRVADFPLSYLSLAASASMQTRVDAKYVRVCRDDAEQCSLTVHHLANGRSGYGTWRQWCILPTQASRGC